jgi:hypothetical protein
MAKVLEKELEGKVNGNQLSNSALKDALYKELELKVDLAVEGISFVPSDLKQFGIGTEYQEQIHILFDMDKQHHPDVLLPAAFYLPHGLLAAFRWNPNSPYRLAVEDGQPLIYKYRYGKEPIRIAEIEFRKRPELLSRKTSDGEPFGHIAAFTPEGGVFVCYSNECSLKDKGEDCLYCNINSTAGAYRKEKIFLKTPKQVAEVFTAAFNEGVGNQLNVTGGFIPERREFEYYVDVAEEVKDQSGLSDFNGTAVVGAPLDFSIIDKYKEAGYRNVAMNIEIWDKHIWKTICPGKDSQCGGWENWVKALEYAARVFGRGKIRSNIVAGIEPKRTILEGVEYLAEKGVICYAGPWCPNPGSELEGHRTPETSWHVDLYHKVAGIFKKYGFTLREMYDCAAANTPVHDIYRIEEEQFEGGRLKQWNFPKLERGGG